MELSIMNLFVQSNNQVLECSQQQTHQKKQNLWLHLHNNNNNNNNTSFCRATFCEKKYQVFKNSPYFPGLAPWDSFMFSKLKISLQGSQFFKAM
jgi:hypothetical protein